MKFALIFLMAFVALSQQFYLQRPNMPMVWLSPHPARHFVNNYRPLVVFNEDSNRDSADSQSNTDGQQEDYPDIQSRVKGNRPLLSEIQPQSGRFLAGSFGNTDGYNYNGNQNIPFLRTYTTTTTSTATSYSLSTSTSTSITVSSTTSTSTATVISTATLSLTSVVRCVPSLQVSAIPASCGRKKRGIDEDSEEHHQFIISPSETLKLMPTALSSVISERTLPVEQLASSKDEVTNAEVSKEDQKREKRFFLLNRNFYSTSTVMTTSTSIIVFPTTTVSQSISTVTTFATVTSTAFVFSNSTVTQTVNLLNPAPAVQCQAVAVAAGTGTGAAAAIPQCISCLPVGIIVCPASG